MPIQNPDCFEQRESEYRNYTLLNQKYLVLCEDPVSCSLDITDVQVTNVTVQDGDDGQIQVTISGGTGDIDWVLNGIVVATNTDTTYTFSNLSSGYYQVGVSDDNCVRTRDNIKVLDGEFRTGDFSIKKPSDLTASENPIIYEIGTSVTSVGAKAEMDFVIKTGTTNDGDYFKFILSSPYTYEQTFYASGFPDKTNYFLASELINYDGEVVGTNTPQEIAQSLADALLQDILIPKVYRISYDGDRTVKLKAREVGERFTLDNDNIKVFGSNLSTTLVQQGENSNDGQQVDGYSIYLELFINEDVSHYPNTGHTDDYSFIAEIELPYQVSNRHRFDLSNILRNFVYSSKPPQGFTGYTIQPDMLKPYYVKYGEKYPLIKNTNTKKKRYKGIEPVKWVINSALDNYVPNNMSGYTGTMNGNYPTSYWITDVPFLTNSPEPKMIQRESKEYLYFIYPEDYNTDTLFRCQGNIHYYDGSVDNDIFFYDIIDMNTNAAGGVMAIDISYDRLGLGSYEITKKIKKVEIWVHQLRYNAHSIYSKIKTYRFEIEDKPRKFGIVFQNVLGGYDSFDFIGIVEQTIDRSYGTYTVPINANPDGSLSQGYKKTSTYDVKVVNKIIVNSGWIDEEHFEWLKELMESNEIYSHTTDNMNYLNLTNFKYNKSSLDDLYEIEASFIQTSYENNITL
jgi:hypothetical protein